MTNLSLRLGAPLAAALCAGMIFVAGGAAAQTSEQSAAELNSACRAAYDDPNESFDYSRDAHYGACDCLANLMVERGLSSDQISLLTAAASNDMERLEALASRLDEAAVNEFETVVTEAVQVCDPEG